MGYWKVTWFDGSNLKEIHTPYTSIEQAVLEACSRGASAFSILKVERVPS